MSAADRDSFMNVTEAVETRLELKEYSDEPVDEETKLSILDAGRLAPSGRNLQHWRFILIDSEDELSELASMSPSGRWIGGADFAIAICTDSSHDNLREQDHIIDAGRAITQMQLVAWEHGVASRIYTVDGPAVPEYLNLPEKYDLPLIAGFGYLTRELKGIKDRKPLEEIVFQGSFGSPLDLERE